MPHAIEPIIGKHDVIHKPESTWCMPLPSKHDRATDMGNIQRKSHEVGHVVFVIHKQTDRQAGWFLRPDCTPSSERQQFRSLHAGAARRLLLHAGATPHFQRAHTIRSEGAAGMANFKIYLLRQFCSNRVNFFTIHRRHRCKKMMDQNFEIRFLWFLNFQKGVARSLWGRSGPL